MTVKNYQNDGNATMQLMPAPDWNSEEGRVEADTDVRGSSLAPEIVDVAEEET